MAVSLEGAFTILDKATGPMRRMELQAQRTDRAIKDLGRSMDAVGGRQQSRQFEATERHLRNIGRESDVTARNSDKLDRSFKRTSRSTEGLMTKLAKLGGAFYGLSKIFAILKIPAIIAGFGMLTKVVSALGAGIVALLPRLADLAGIAGALPAAFVGMGLAVGTVKLAFSDFTKALGGNKNALKNLTPEARSFLATVKQYKPVMVGIRQAAQRGLFPGLESSLRRVQRAVPAITALMEGMGGTLGRGTSRLTKRFTTQSFLSDFTKIGQQGTKIVGTLMAAFGNLISAARHVAVAAMPFTDWLRTLVLDGSRAIDRSAKLGRETGRLGAFFERTRKSMTTFGHILRDLWFTFVNIGKAARPLGEDLWKSAEKATARWRAFTGSLRGQAGLGRWFENSRPVLHEVFGLIGDIGKALGRIGNDPAAAGFVRTLRGMVPTLEKIVQNATRAFGPAMLTAIKSILEAFSHTSYMSHIVVLLGNIAKVVSWLLEKLPPLQILLAGFLTYKLFSGPITALRTLIASWRGVTASATEAAVAQRGAAMAGGLNVVSAGGAAGGAVMLSAQQRAMARSGARPGGFGFAGGMSAQQQAMMARGSAMAPAAAKPVSRMGAMAATAGGAVMAGLPLALAMAGGFGLMNALAMGTGGQGAMGLGRNFFSGVSMGMIPDTNTQMSEQQTADQTSLSKLLGRAPKGRNTRAVRGQIALLNQAQAKADTDTSGARHDAITASIQAEIDARRALIPQLQAEASALSGQRGQQYSDSQLKAFQIDLKKFGPQRAIQELTKSTLGGPGGIGKRGFQGAKVVSEDALAMARQVAKGNPKLMGEYKKLEAGVKQRFSAMGRHAQIVNGKILTGSKREWAGIREAIVKPAEQAKQRASDAFTKLQRKAVGSLVAMGIPAADARRIVAGSDAAGAPATPGNANTRRNQTATGAPNLNNNPLTGAANPITQNVSGQATGGRIDGRGLRDTVPVGSGMLAAPGEMIVNRHTEGRLDSMLSAFGTSLSNEVGKEMRPHWALPPVSSTRGYSVGGVIQGAARAPTTTGGGGGGVVTSGAAGEGPWGSGSGFVPLTEFAKKVGLQATSGKSNHSATTVYGGPSDHATGQAVDYSNGSSPTRQMNEFAKFMGWTGGSTTSGPTFPPSKQIIYETMMGGNHYNHVHTALDAGWAFSAPKMAEWINARAAGANVGGLAVGAGGAVLQMKPLVAPKSGLRGAPGVIADTGMKNVYAGATNVINSRLASGGGAAQGGTGTGLVVTGKVSTFGPPGEAAGSTATGVSSALPGVAINPNGGDFNEGRKYLGKNWRITIGGKSGILKQTDLGPAGWTGRRIDVTGAGAAQLGIPQGSFPTDSIGTAELMARMGRRVPWHGAGGLFTATSPQILGVGERGAETVKVSPKGSREGRIAQGIRIGKIHIQNHRPGDIQAQVEKEVTAAFSNLTRTLDLQPMVDDEGGLA